MSIILNKEELAITPLRKDALEILEAGYEAIQTEKILRGKISASDGVLSVDGKEFDLKSFERVFFVGIGKCALDGARVIEDVLGDRLTEGIALDVKTGPLKKIKSIAGTHPLPSEQNIVATKEILDMVREMTEKDLIITLISGGGSALFELPNDGFDLDTIVNITNELTAQGADIYKLNKVRKTMSKIKGGKFATFCAPAKMISLIFSDVLGNDITVVASGPTVLDEPSERVTNVLVVSNTDALEAMEQKAQELGYAASIATDRFSGDAKEMGKKLAFLEPKSKTCILMGGETTVKFGPNHGLGGRNQAMALSTLSHIKKDMVLICASSDGWDNTEYAGALADTALLEKAKDLNLNPEEFLERSDSFNFFKQVSGGIYTGKLGSNVSDLYIIIYK